MNPFWMVLADLRKTVLTSLGILLLLSLAFSATVTVSLFDRSLREAGAASARDFDLVVGAPGSRLDLVLSAVFLRTEETLPLLPFEVMQKLQKDPRVALVSPLILSDHSDDFPIVGVGADFPKMRPTFKLASGRWPEKPFEMVAGVTTGRTVGMEFHGSHGTSRKEGFGEEVHHQAAYRVVGTLLPTGTPWDRALLTPFDSIWALHEDPSTARKVSAILVKPRDFASAYGLRAEYREGLTTAAFPGEVLAGLFGLFDSLKTALSLVSLVFQVLVFAAVVLSLLAALPTKARWIGLLRALGAGPGYIFLTLWIQAASVFLVAGLVGVGVGWIGAQALATLVATQSGLSLSVAWSSTEALVLGVFWLAGLAGALVPAVMGYATSVRRSLLGQ